MPIEKPKSPTDQIDMLWTMIVGVDEDGMYYDLKAMRAEQKKRPATIIQAIASVATSALSFGAGVLIAYIQSAPK